MDLCRTVILTDEPEQNDAFSGPHQRIAEAIAGLIQAPDAKGISIGVEGSWGSGKSTVARLLTRKLESDKNIGVVPFDAWAHEGDPLRRTFLETVIRRLQERGWIDQNNWDEAIEELANRREVVKTKDNLSITNWGLVIAFTLLLIPIGTAFLTAALREDITLYPGPIAVRFLIYFIAGLALILTPLSIFLLRIKKEPDLLSLLINKGPTEKTTVTSKTVNPTSIEFEESFKKLLKEALTKEPQNRIVLILDNLDRVDAKDALSIWSTLQTFLQHKGTSRPSWHERVWLLVLYDLQGLSQLWENAENKAGKKTAASFIDKSFQIRFEVPALVPSDWSTFLLEQLKKAFEDHTDFDRYEVYRVLAISVEKGNQLPTIRGLKLFINQIGAIHRQWARSDTRPVDTFPLSHIACYVLLRPEVDIIKELYNPGFPQKEYQDLLGSSVRENLAGLAFNVETDVAQQLLFSDKIKGALLRRTDEDLKTVSSKLRRGFWHTLEQIATTQWAFTEASNMAEAALELEESGLLITAPPPSARLITKTICDAALTVPAWWPLDHNKAKGLAVLIKWELERQGSVAQHQHFIEKLFRAIALGLNEHAMRTDITLNAKNWLDCVSVITQELDPSLKQKALRIVFDTLSDRLRLPDPLQPRESEPILEILSELQEMPDLDLSTGKTLTDLADEGRVAAQFRQDIATSPGAVAWITYVLIRYSSAFRGLPLQGESYEQEQAELKALFSEPMVETFVAILERFKQDELVFRMSENAHELRPLVIRLLEIVLNRPHAHELFTSGDGVNRLEFVFEMWEFRRGIDSLMTKLVAETRQRLNIVDELTSRSFKESNANLYLLVLQLSAGRQEKFESWCVAGLRAIGSSWLDYLWGGNPLLLALHLSNRGIEVELGEQYSIALVKTMEFHQKDQNWFPTSSPEENLAALIGPLENPFRIDPQKYLVNLISSDRDLPAWLFPLFGTELRAQLLYSANGLQVLEVLQFIIRRGDESGLEWLRDLLSEAGKSLESRYSDETAWSDLKKAVRQALATEVGTQKPSPLLKSIASILNIRFARNGVIAFGTSDTKQIFIMNPRNPKLRTRLREPFPECTILSDPSWSPYGKKLAYIGGTEVLGASELIIFDFPTGVSTPITGASRDRGQPSWSPDGAKLAFVKDNGPYRDIYTIDLETKEERQLTKESPLNEWPNWSPDGSRLVFHRIHEREVRIFVMNADGSNQIAITTGTKDYDPSWTPDGTQIVFARWVTPPEKCGIYLMNPDGSELVQLIQENDPGAPIWSPDGSKLLFQAGHGSEARIYQVDADGKNKEELIRGVTPSWQPIVDELSESPAESTAETTPTFDSPN